MTNPSLRRVRGIYYIRVRGVDQKEKITSTGTRDRKAALLALDRYCLEIIARENGYKGEFTGMAPSFRQTKGAFIVDCTRNGLRPATVKSYETSLDNFSNTFPYNAQVIHLNETIIRQFADNLRTTGKKGKRTASSVNVNLRSVRTFVNWLLEQKYIPKKIKVKMMRVDKKKPKILTPKELQEIYKLINDPKLLATFRVYELTGMRLSELHSCEREGNFIRVIAETAKGRSDRIVPLPEEIKDDYELARTNPYPTNYITKKFTYYRKEAKVAEGKSLHSLRHTFAARTLLSEKDPYLVKLLLGHQSITTTEIYLQFPAGYLKEILTVPVAPVTEVGQA